MTYINQNLITGESVRYQTGLHWIVLVTPILAGFFLLFVSLAMFVSSVGAGITSLLVTGLVTAIGFLRRSASEFAVTNKRVILKAGLLRRRSLEMLLGKIESVGVDQGLLGRILGYGTVVVRGTGGTAEPFTTVRHALEFRRQVQEQIDRAQLAMATSVGK